MRNILSKVFQLIVIVGGVVLFVSGCLAYFVRTYDAQTGVYYDGLGGKLSYFQHSLGFF